MTDREKEEEGASRCERKIEGVWRGGEKEGTKVVHGTGSQGSSSGSLLNRELLFRDLEDVSLPTKDISDHPQASSARYDHEDQVFTAIVMA